MPLIFPAPKLLQLHKNMTADCRTAGGSYTNRISNVFRVKNVEIVECINMAVIAFLFMLTLLPRTLFLCFRPSVSSSGRHRKRARALPPRTARAAAAA